MVFLCSVLVFLAPGGFQFFFVVPDVVFLVPGCQRLSRHVFCKLKITALVHTNYCDF